MSPAEQRLRAVAGARRALRAFGPVNRYQGELQALLEVMLDHIERLARRPGARDEYEEWWIVLGTYRQTLASPEMAGRRARTVLAKLLRRRREEIVRRAR